MQHLRRTLILIAYSLLLSGVLFTGTFLTFSFITSTRHTPASFLPAQRTAALFLRTSNEDLTPFTSLFSSLAEIPAIDGTFDLALLRDGESGLKWKVFREGVPQDSSTSAATGTFLREDLSYRTLIRVVKRGEPAVYIADAALLTPHSLVDRVFFALLHFSPSAPFVHTREKGTWITAALSKTPTVQRAPLLLPNSRPPTPPLFSLRGTNLSDLFFSILTALPPSEQIVLEGLLDRTTHSLFGKETSFRYDLLPLLETPALLHFFSTGSGESLALLLESRSTNREHLAARLARLHKNVASTLPLERISRRVLDPTRGFKAETMRRDPSLLQTEERMRGDWFVRITAHRLSGRGLATSMKGNRFFLSSSPELLESMLAMPAAGTPQELFVAPQAGEFAGGTLDPTLLRKMLGEEDTAISIFLPPQNSTESLTWKLDQWGNVRRLMLNAGVRH